MRYGHFDEKAKEYVITKPDTPAAWANYLGSPEYGAIISGNAGGYSFVKSGANGRIIRYRFNSVAMDQPGRYIYLRDLEDKDFWSNSWAPVCKPLDSFKSECRHGTGYTVISSQYKGISTQTSYYVPLGQTYEVWSTTVANDSDRPRRLSVTGYCEFVNDSNYEQDQVNLQYSLFITRTAFTGRYIFQTKNEQENVGGPGLFFGLAGAKADHFCGDRDKFVGNYRGYHNPVGIEEGLQGDMNFCGNSCGALETELSLAPHETKTLVFLLGQKTKAEADSIIETYSDTSTCANEIAALKAHWHGKLENLVVKTPDDSFNNMVNVWNAYNCFLTFTWSRAASFIYCGLRNGFGYRDTVQDIQGIIHLAPDMAYEQLKFMLSAQTRCGAGLPLVKYTHNAGSENTPEDEEYVRETGHPSYRADDALWLFPTVSKYISESGNIGFLDEEIFFADGGEKATVYEHLKRAIRFSLDNLGSHGMMAGLHADWNDCLRLGKKGESTFVAFQFVLAVKLLREYAVLKKDEAYVGFLDETLAKLTAILEKCYDEDRWIRGYREDGTVIGSRKDPEASMWLNPQSWSVIAGFGSEEQQRACMDSVERELNTDFGAMLMYPPYDRHAFDGALCSCYNKTVKENAGIFSQPQGWLILAEARLGHGNRAYKYWQEASPASYNDRAELREMEPYVYGQFVEGKDSPFAGRAHVHWLTGTASTVMVGTVEGILGLRPTVDGIVIDPSIPSEWKSFTMKKNFRGRKLNIQVNNPDGAEHGVKSVSVNGKAIEGLLISESLLEAENEIIITM